MRNIGYDSGVITYTVNDGYEISFNPTDSAFVERLFNAFEVLDKKQESYRNEIEKMADKKAIFEYARQRDKEMRELIDGIFEDSVSDGVFGKINVYALGSGLPIWANFILAVMDEIDTAFAREQKATNTRVQKYLNKYKNRK